MDAQRRMNRRVQIGDGNRVVHNLTPQFIRDADEAGPFSARHPPGYRSVFTSQMIDDAQAGPIEIPVAENPGDPAAKLRMEEVHLC